MCFWLQLQTNYTTVTEELTSNCPQLEILKVIKLKLKNKAGKCKKKKKKIKEQNIIVNIVDGTY